MMMASRSKSLGFAQSNIIFLNKFRPKRHTVKINGSESIPDNDEEWKNILKCP